MEDLRQKLDLAPGESYPFLHGVHYRLDRGYRCLFMDGSSVSVAWLKSLIRLARIDRKIDEHPSGRPAPEKVTPTADELDELRRQLGLAFGEDFPFMRDLQFFRYGTERFICLDDRRASLEWLRSLVRLSRIDRSIDERLAHKAPPAPPPTVAAPASPAVAAPASPPPEAAKKPARRKRRRFGPLAQAQREMLQTLRAVLRIWRSLNRERGHRPNEPRRRGASRT